VPRAAALPLYERNEGNDFEEVSPIMRKLAPPGLRDDLLRVDFFVGPSFFFIARCVQKNALENFNVLLVRGTLELRLVRAQVEGHFDAPQIVAVVRFDKVHWFLMRLLMGLRRLHAVVFGHVLAVGVGVGDIVVIAHASQNLALDERGPGVQQL
jgi:hypothetical protein